MGQPSLRNKPWGYACGEAGSPGLIGAVPPPSRLARGPLTRPRRARSYAGGRTAEAFMSFIQGKLAEDKGFARVPSLDRLAAAFPHEARRPGAAGRGGGLGAAPGSCVPEQRARGGRRRDRAWRAVAGPVGWRPAPVAVRPLPSWPRARREHGRAVSLALQAARVHDTRHGASPGAACAAAQGGPWSAWGTPARRAGLERASPRLLRARRDRAGAARQADKEGALEALKAAAAELTSPEEAEHAKLYVRFASKALEKVGAPQTLTLQRRAAVGPRR